MSAPEGKGRYHDVLPPWARENGRPRKARRDRPPERWREIPGWEHYEASNHGRIRRAIGGRGTYEGRVLSPWPSGGRKGNGYYYVDLCVDGIRSARLVHRLVARAWLGAPPHEDAQVDHLNSRKADNRPANLEWVDQEENLRRMNAT